ncbi:Uncharacterised protein at_DN1651, partial [Pycnogonum litorale]
MSKLLAPLTRLLKKDVPFMWTKHHDDVFNNAKSVISSGLVVHAPVGNGRFIISTDASISGLGSMITQMQNGQEKIIAYASRTLHPYERNYSASELECLAVVWAVKHFRYYVEGQTFSIFTDHMALRWLMQHKDPSSRLMKWSLALQEFDFEIFHRKGKTNVIPDALSRMYECQKHSSFASTGKVFVAKNCPGDNCDQAVQLPAVHLDLNNFQEQQRSDPFFSHLVRYLTTSVLPSGGTLKRQILKIS